MGETGQLAGLSRCLLLLMLIVTCRGQEQRWNLHQSGNRGGLCWPMDETWCPDQVFNSSFIRFRGSGDDLVQFQGLISLLQDRCPEYFAKFLCRSFFTACSDGMEPLDSALPCRSFCESAYEECNDVIESFGITWPKKLRCKKFPRKKCMSSEQTRTINDDRPTPHPATVATVSLSCEPLTTSFCETVGYNSTGFPNVLGQYSQAGAELIMSRFYPLVQMGCYDQLLEFVCRAHVPECRAGSVDNNPTNVLIMPCRSLCEAAKRACGDIVNHEILEDYNKFWPEWVTCDLFPTQKCISPPQQERSVNDDISLSLYPAVVATTCEPITLQICQTIGYNLTAFPNVLGQNSQADAELTINQIVLLVEVGCFDQLSEFFCRVILPECRADNSSLIMPCRSFCESAKAGCGPILERFGFLWPVSCGRLPTQNCRGLSGFVEVEQREPDPLPTAESSKHFLDDLNAAVDSLNAHVQKLISTVPSRVESCHRTAAVTGLEYALKGLRENVEMSSTFLHILEDDV